MTVTPEGSMRITHGDSAFLLTALNTATRQENIALLPGFHLHPLKGERDGQWAVSVSGNWRLVFEFDGEDVTNIDLVDYH